MQFTVNINDDLASRVKRHETRMPQIIEMGMRQWEAKAEPGYVSIDDILEKLASLPSPTEVLAIRPSPILQKRIDELLEKNRTSVLSVDEQNECDRYLYAEHLVQLAKVSALRKLKEAKSS